MSAISEAVERTRVLAGCVSAGVGPPKRCPRMILVLRAGGSFSLIARVLHGLEP
jgi:hypothetical protein